MRRTSAAGHRLAERVHTNEDAVFESERADESAAVWTVQPGRVGLTKGAESSASCTM